MEGHRLRGDSDKVRTVGANVVMRLANPHGRAVRDRRLSRDQGQGKRHHQRHFASSHTAPTHPRGPARLRSPVCISELEALAHRPNLNYKFFWKPYAERGQTRSSWGSRPAHADRDQTPREGRRLLAASNISHAILTRSLPERVPNNAVRPIRLLASVSGASCIRGLRDRLVQAGPAEQPPGTSRGSGLAHAGRGQW